MGARTALCKPRLALSETKLALLPGSAAHPVQNSPSEPQNADFGPLFACRENFLPLPPPTTRAGRTLSRMRGRFRYKTLPARPARRPTRYKTLPARPARRPTRYKTRLARPKTPILAHFAPAGRTLYRFRHQHDEQGELYPARRATSGTKLSQHTPPTGPTGTKLALPPGSPAHPVQNSPSTPGSAANPVQNSPSTPQNADFGPFCASRENFVPFPPPTRQAGRKKSRTNTPPHPNNASLSKFRMQFDCMNFQQSPETLQFQRHEFTL